MRDRYTDNLFTISVRSHMYMVKQTQVHVVYIYLIKTPGKKNQILIPNDARRKVPQTRP